jgi:ABC-type polysaccharide/polyol phosphate export permease
MSSEQGKKKDKSGRLLGLFLILLGLFLASITIGMENKIFQFLLGIFIIPFLFVTGIIYVMED